MTGGCEEFIAWILAAADASRELAPRERALDLARRLVREFVPELRLLGRDRRSWIAPGFRCSATEPHPETWDAADFRRRLTEGGQDDEALRHVAAAAAAVLSGRTSLVWLASCVDWLQGRQRGRRGEARAEIAGNRTGVVIGRMLSAYLHGTRTREALARDMGQLLCRGTSTQRSAPVR